MDFNTFYKDIKQCAKTFDKKLHNIFVKKAITQVFKITVV